jgi:glutamate/tyrosine decarboxylase-like PLP-dependent enzyme
VRVQPANSPKNNAVYKRSAKGVLAITRQSREFTTVAKDLFFSINGETTADDLAARSNANAAYVYATLKTWEREGYVQILRHVSTPAMSIIDDAAEETDLDFTQETGSAQTTRLRSRRESAADETALWAHTLAAKNEKPEAQPESMRVALKQAPAAQTESMRVALKHAPEAQTESMRIALKQAQESVRDMSSQLESERRSRQETLQALSEARTQADKQRSVAEAQRQTLTKVQDELAAARRAHEAQSAQHRARNEAQTRMLAEADIHRKALEADLNKTRMERECAIKLLAEQPWALSK